MSDKKQKRSKSPKTKPPKLKKNETKNSTSDQKNIEDDRQRHSSLVKKRIVKIVPHNKKIEVSTKEFSTLVIRPSQSIKTKYASQIFKNTYDIFQIKRLIGKKLLILWKDSLNNKEKIYQSKKIKDILLKDTTDKNKNIVFSAVCDNGILHVISNIEYYLALVSISYKEIETSSICKSISITIIQYPKMPISDIKVLIS